MPACSVVGCTKEKRNKFDPEHRFFTFPRTSPLLEKWIKFCRKDSLTKEQCLTKGPKICSIHFKEEYIEIPLKYRLLPQFTPKNMRILRKDAVPTIRNPKKKKEDEEDEEKQLQKKLEYSRIVAELLEQSEKDAASEKERLEKESEVGAEKGENTREKGEAVLQTALEHDECTSAGKKARKTKKPSTSQSKEKSRKTIKEPFLDTNIDETKLKRSKKKAPSQGAAVPDDKNSKSKSAKHNKKVSFADPERPGSDDENEMFESDFQTEDADNQTNTVSGSDQQTEDTTAELLRLQRENQKLTDLTIKQSLQIADLIKQRNDLWREKGDLWFRKRMEHHQQQQQQQQQQQLQLPQPIPQQQEPQIFLLQSQ